MEIQDKILKTSLQLFFKLGIKHVTMDDIARELGMSKKTIYQFYKEKDDLVTQLCDQVLRFYEGDFKELNETAKDPIQEIMVMSEKMREMIKNINPVFFIDLQKFYPQAYNRYLEFRHNCAFRQLKKNIQKGIEMGLYRPDLDVEFVSNYRLIQMDTLMFGNFFSFERITLAKTHELLIDMFVHGICTIKGHKLINQYKKIEE